MSILTWNEQLRLGNSRLDDEHREIIDALQAMRATLDAEAALPAVLSQFEGMIAFTEAHFALEEDWMAASGFARDNCHSKQHAMVLEVMEQVRDHVRDEADLGALRTLLDELSAWLPAHVDMMDAALVYHLGQVGFDPATGLCSKPLPEQGLSSCGSAACG